jgi:hypothetical protein
MSLQFIIAIAVVVLIILIVLKFQPSDNKRRTQYKKHYDKSSGIFDNSAKQALDLINDIKEPTPDDHYTKAIIYEQNMLGGDLRKTTPDILNNMITSYTNVLNGVRVGTNDRLQRRLNPRAVADRPLAQAIDMLDRATVHNHNDIFLIDAAEIFEDQLARLDNVREMADPQLINMLHHTANNMNGTREKNTIERKAIAAESANTRTEYVDKYFNETARVESNPQNVHDSKVNDDFRDILSILKESVDGRTGADGRTGVDAIKQARDFIGIADISAGRKVDAINVLNTIENVNAYVSTYDINERDLFGLIWMRAYHPRNNPNTIKTAIIDGLADSVEHGTVVCVNEMFSFVWRSGC